MPETTERDPVLAPVATTAGIVAFIVTLPLVYAYAFVAALVAAAGGVVIGAPALAAARNLGLRGVWATAALGLVAGPVPLALVKWISGVAPQHWPLHELGPAAVIGASTGAIYATVYDTTNLPPGAVRRRTIAILSLAVFVTFAMLRLA